MEGENKIDEEKKMDEELITETEEELKEEESRREGILEEIAFEKFVLKYQPKINEAANMIRQPFETEVTSLEKQIGDICGKMELISWCLARANELLVNAEHKCLIAKRKDITDTDRRIALAYSTSKENLIVDWLKGLDEKIMKYLDKAQSVLAVERAIIDKAGYGGKR